MYQIFQIFPKNYTERSLKDAKSIPQQTNT